MTSNLLGVMARNPEEMTTVTFDSNVWEQIVDPVKRSQDAECSAIHTGIEAGMIRPYFFEGILVLESVKKVERKEYFTKYRPTISTKIGAETPVIRVGTPAPELSEYLMRVVPMAISLGFRFIRLPRIGMPIGPTEWAASEEFYSLEDRLTRSFEFVRYADSLNPNGINLAVGQGVSPLNEKKYASVVAEQSDIDALAAHYGYGIDIFCTRDQGKTAGRYSVLSEENFSAINNKYPIVAMTPAELCGKLSLQI